ncbi:MAG: immunoglobulin domain-containing protein, partial [Limisphaerales bacterium]
TPTLPSFYGAYGGVGPDTNSFGTNYFVKAKGTGSAYLQFNPTIITAGDYNIYQWHPERTDASTNVPFVITYNGGSATVYANQKTNSGNWSSLGRFPFAAGTKSGTIRVMDNFPETTAVALVDGLKLVFVPPTTLPATPTLLSATAVSGSQINLSWRDNSTNETAYFVARSSASGGPYMDIAALGINTTNFSNTGLSAVMTYYYVVRATNYLGLSGNSFQASATTFGPPTIITPPQSQTVKTGTNVVFNVIASGSSPLNYQWQWNGTNLLGAVTNLLTLMRVTPANNGLYSVTISNLDGTTNSSANLIVNPPPSPFLGLLLLTDQVQISLNGDPGVSYTIQTSTNLTNWFHLTNTFSLNGVIQLTQPLTNSAQFYRSIWLP